MNIKNFVDFIFSIKNFGNKKYKKKIITIFGLKITLSKKNKSSNKINLLYCPSDNYALSGAFLSMVTLCSLLKDNFNVNPIIILPKKGSGTDLLKKAKIRYKIIESEDWILPIGCSFSDIINKIRLSIKNLKAIFKIVKLIYKENIDIVHLNTVWGYVGGIAAVLTRKPLVWHIRECIKEGQGKDIFIGNIGYKLINMSTNIIVISNAVLTKYPKLNRNKVKIIYNGINDQLFYKANHKILQQPVIKFVCVGNVQFLKGQQDLVEACNMLAKNNITNWELNIIGQGKNLEGITSLIEKYNLSEKIRVLGKKSDVQNYFAESDISFVPSHFEAFGRVTVEAMLCGCLVIAANAGGTPEIIQNAETGIMHEVGNPKDIYDKIVWAMNNREKCINIANNGRQHALSSFIASENAKKISELYKNILRRE